MLEERLFKKSKAGEDTFRELYRQRGGVLKDIGELVKVDRALPVCDEGKFIARLLTSRVDADFSALRSQVETGLQQLITARYIARTGEQYEYLSGERKRIEEEIAEADVRTAHKRDRLKEFLTAANLEVGMVRYEDAYRFDVRVVCDDQVDWEHDGTRIKATPGPRVQNAEYYFKDGWTYSYMASGSLGLRALESRTVFSHLASAVFFHNDLQGGAAAVNCRFSSMLVRSISAKIQLSESYVSRIPFPELMSRTLTNSLKTEEA